MPINGRWSGNRVLPLAKENKCKAAGEEEPGALQNQKLSISLGAGTGGCGPGCLGNSSMVLRERPARELGAMDQRLPGAECWNLPWERKRQLEAGVPEKPLFNSTGINWMTAVLKARGGGAEEARESCFLSVEVYSQWGGAHESEG